MVIAMAIWARAHRVRVHTEERLEMHNCCVLARNPNKINIRYTVEEKPADLMCPFGPIISHVQQHTLKSHRIIAFCRTYDDCSAIFQLLALELSSRHVFIFPDQSDPRKFICEKFTACSSPKTKSVILRPLLIQMVWSELLLPR